MGKLTSYASDTAPTTDDKIPTIDSTSGLNKIVLLSDLLTLFFNQTSIPSGSASPVTRWSENGYDYVASGGVWSADSVGVNRNASMTAMVCYINGRRLSISAVTARTFTASKDTYIDVLDNFDGTGTLVYTEATNNAASSALAANSLRIGIIVTGATTIAASTSINQGQETRVLPIASSIAYSVTDSLGNLICPRDPNRKIIGWRQTSTNFVSTTSAVQQGVTGLSCPVIVPTGRKTKITFHPGIGVSSSGVTGTGLSTAICLGSAADANKIAYSNMLSTSGAGVTQPGIAMAFQTPASTTQTYLATVAANGVNTTSITATPTGGVNPAFIVVELD